MAHTIIFGSEKLVETWVWPLVDDIDEFNRFPWGAYAYKLFCHYTTHAGTSPKWHYYGPSWALMVWALECLPGLGDEVGKRVGGRRVRVDVGVWIDQPYRGDCFVDRFTGRMGHGWISSQFRERDER